MVKQEQEVGQKVGKVGTKKLFTCSWSPCEVRFHLFAAADAAADKKETGIQVWCLNDELLRNPSEQKENPAPVL